MIVMYLYGASGHGRVIKEILEAEELEAKAFVDDNPQLEQLDGVPVLHQADGLSPMIVSIGDNRIRKRIAESLDCSFGVAIHPSAVVSPSARIGAGTVVMAGAVVNAGAVIGRHCIINTGASVDHECVLGDYCHVAPHAALCGNVRIGEGTLVGVGASVIPCVKVGEWSIVGAGAVVTGDLPAHCTTVGVPAKVINYKNKNQTSDL